MAKEDSDLVFQNDVTNNSDVAGLCSRLSRFVEEALKSQSANGAAIQQWDLQRLKSYISAAKTYKEFVQGQPVLDMPESHPYELTIKCPAMSNVELIENESVRDWTRLVLICINELVHSQSSRLGSAFVSHDAIRFDNFMAKIEAFITGYVEQALPLDLPESIPTYAGVTSGRKGI